MNQPDTETFASGNATFEHGGIGIGQQKQLIRPILRNMDFAMPGKKQHKQITGLQFFRQSDEEGDFFHEVQQRKRRLGAYGWPHVTK